jgi:hypothetical protein
VIITHVPFLHQMAPPHAHDTLLVKVDAQGIGNGQVSFPDILLTMFTLLTR